MAINLKHTEAQEFSDINMTPFIDVILVLLIIFMVAAPLSTVDVPVDLPSSNAAPGPHPDKPVILSLDRDLNMTLGEQPVARQTIGQALDAQTSSDHTTRIYLRADQSVGYGELMKVMNLLRSAGYVHVALVGMEEGAPPR